jgi:hypothetical protein
VRDESFVQLLEQHQFHVVVLGRHPLDMLISGLNYEQYISDPTVWTDEAGVQHSLRGASPISQEFYTYAARTFRTSPLTVSHEWWPTPGVTQVRYEDLVSDTEASLDGLSRTIAAPFKRPIAEVVAQFAITSIRSRYDVWHYHFWQGRPGLWRSLLPAGIARGLAAVHRDVFATLGYTCDPDETLTHEQAESNWRELQLRSVRSHLADEQRKHAETKRLLELTREQLERVHAILYQERLLAQSNRDALAAAETHTVHLQTRLDKLESIQPHNRGPAQLLAHFMVHFGHRPISRPRLWHLRPRADLKPNEHVNSVKPADA